MSTGMITAIEHEQALVAFDTPDLPPTGEALAVSIPGGRLLLEVVQQEAQQVRCAIQVHQPTSTGLPDTDR